MSRVEHHPSRIMIVAGEASGDKHGASLARALQRLSAGAPTEIFGAGGDEMRSAGVETLVDARDVAIIGVPEIARSLPRLYRTYRTLLSVARRRRPDAVVLIDWPDFNLRLAKKLHREGFKVIYYVSPQIWAWRQYRVRAIRRDVDRMLVILPFEEEFYKRRGVNAEYVGHPLVDAVTITASRSEFASRHDVDPNRPFIALLPGSRRKEIHYHLPAMIEAAARLQKLELRIEDKTVALTSPQSHVSGPQSAIHNRQSTTPQFLVPLASTASRAEVGATIAGARGEEGVEITVVEGDTYNALGHAEFAIVASGTATVEAALAGTPMVIVYRASEINWLLLRPLIHLDTFGMVNLIAGRRIVPELIQHQVTGERIAAEAEAILLVSHRLAQMREDLAMVREKLRAGGGSAPERAARAVMEVIGIQGRSSPTRG